MSRTVTEAHQSNETVQAAFRRVQVIRDEHHERVAHIQQLPEVERDGAMGKAYGEAAELAAEAAFLVFDAIARAEGLTGFQGSFASLVLLRKTHNIEGPFALMRLERELYPQYDLGMDFDSWRHSDESNQWLKEEAQKRLDKGQRAEMGEDGTVFKMPVDAVWEHWQTLAGWVPEPEEPKVE